MVGSVDIRYEQVKREIDRRIEGIGKHTRTVGRHLLNQRQSTTVRRNEKRVVVGLWILWPGWLNEGLRVAGSSLRRSDSVLVQRDVVRVKRNGDANINACPVRVQRVIAIGLVLIGVLHKQLSQ